MRIRLVRIEGRKVGSMPSAGFSWPNVPSEIQPFL
jgi:hypothetical protein